jgi:hypothetical protein
MIPMNTLWWSSRRRCPNNSGNAILSHFFPSDRYPTLVNTWWWGWLGVLV